MRKSAPLFRFDQLRRAITMAAGAVRRAVWLPGADSCLRQQNYERINVTDAHKHTHGRARAHEDDERRRTKLIKRSRRRALPNNGCQRELSAASSSRCRVFLAGLPACRPQTQPLTNSLLHGAAPERCAPSPRRSCTSAPGGTRARALGTYLEASGSGGSVCGPTVSAGGLRWRNGRERRATGSCGWQFAPACAGRGAAPRRAGQMLEFKVVVVVVVVCSIQVANSATPGPLIAV
jgi:hypothetical protein